MTQGPDHSPLLGCLCSTGFPAECRSSPRSSRDHQECLQTLLRVPWGQSRLQREPLGKAALQVCTKVRGLSRGVSRRLSWLQIPYSVDFRYCPASCPHMDRVWEAEDPAAWHFSRSPGPAAPTGPLPLRPAHTHMCTHEHTCTGHGQEPGGLRLGT